MMLEERDAYIAIGLAIALTVALATSWYWLAIGAFSLPLLYVAVRGLLSPRQAREGDR
jgi:hypothetical protein